MSNIKDSQIKYIYVLGAKAYHRGEALYNNPYQMNTKNWNEWKQGWEDARDKQLKYFNIEI